MKERTWICVMTVSLLSVWFLAYACGYYNAKKQLCAETQGKYDFCVQKVIWEEI